MFFGMSLQRIFGQYNERLKETFAQTEVLNAFLDKFMIDTFGELQEKALDVKLEFLEWIDANKGLKTALAGTLFTMGAMGDLLSGGGQLALGIVSTDLLLKNTFGVSALLMMGNFLRKIIAIRVAFLGLATLGVVTLAIAVVVTGLAALQFLGKFVKEEGIPFLASGGEESRIRNAENIFGEDSAIAQATRFNRDQRQSFSTNNVIINANINGSLDIIDTSVEVSRQLAQDRDGTIFV